MIGKKGEQRSRVGEGRGIELAVDKGPEERGTLGTTQPTRVL